MRLQGPDRRLDPERLEALDHFGANSTIDPQAAERDAPVAGLSHLTFCGLGEDGDQVGVIPSGALLLSLNRRF